MQKTSFEEERNELTMLSNKSQGIEFMEPLSPINLTVSEIKQKKSLSRFNMKDDEQTNEVKIQDEKVVSKGLRKSSTLLSKGSRLKKPDSVLKFTTTSGK
jgi:hypothetical protein